MRLVLDVEEVTNFINRMKKWPTQFETVQVSALNAFGEIVIRELVRLIAEETGLSQAAAAKFVTYAPATVANRSFLIRVKEDVIEEDAKTDRIPVRTFEERESVAKDDQLFNVVTAKDDAVCEICERISKEGPYSLPQLRAFKGHHPHFLNRDLNCRCETTPFKPTRRIPVRMQSMRGVKLDSPQTARQLAERIRKDTISIIRMT
jgi:hypothetical protein